MVFEAVVVELLNKFLKQYVENLDTSQLKIGIWGGDVVLKDLKIKATIFDDWNLPVRVKWGKLGKFAMKIPWKNLYSSQVSVNIEDLLVVIIPNTEFVYDPVKEEKWAFERKQAKLKAIEEARKKELDPESATETDSFIEKLLTQIIKNIHVVINNIHVRYEDKTTIPNSPVSIGVTLSNLSAMTTATDPNGYFTKMLRENKNFICKLLNLEGLSIYWNSNSDLYSSLNAKELTKVLIHSIPKPGFKPKNMYVFGPLTSSAFLRLNPRPEIDGTNFNVPKVFVQIMLKEIDLAITHNQFCDFMDLLDDSRRLQAANKYKKYRPINMPVKNHAKEWWHFAYKCVAEDIIRRKSEWNWETIKMHRRLGKRYSELYKHKLNMRKMTHENANELNKLERKLSLLNLILIREQVHVEVERDKLNESKTDTRKGGWFSGWFGSNKTSIDMSDNSDELVKKIESVLTPSEKEKLYKAIGYEENAPFAKYPPAFVELQFWFHLEEIKMTLFDDRTSHLVPIMTLSVKNVRTEFERRSSANAYKLVAVIGNFQVIGKADKSGKVPELVTSNCKKSESLVEVLCETKPLNASCDQRIHVNALPLKIVYHAKTINLVRETFTTDVKEMEKIVSATSASLPTFQKITSLGLEYAIEKRAVLEVKVNVKSSYIIIPYEGEYHPDRDMLVIMLGSVTVETENTSHKDVSVKKLYLEGTTDEEIFSTVVSASYTDFKFRLTGVQILFQLSGEDWVAASKVKGPSSMRFLESTNLDIDFKKSLVTDDARIPKIIIRGILPNLTFNLSEKRFVSFVALICSIPMKTECAIPKKPPSAWSLQSLSTNLEHKLKDIPLMKPVVEFTQGIDLVGQFEVKAMIVNVSRTKSTSQTEKKEKFSEDEKFLKLQVTQMEVDVTSKTFEALYLLKVGGISFDHHKQNDVVSVLSCFGLEKHHYLLTVEYVNLNTKIPDFFTKRQGVVNRLTISTASLNVLINKEALLAELQFVRHIQMRVDAVKKETQVDRMADSGKCFDDYNEMGIKDEKKVISRGKRFRKKSQKEVIDLLLVVALEDININVDFEESKLCEFSLRGTKLHIASRKSCVNLDFTLKEIFLLDLNPSTVHQKIIASLEEQTMSSRITLYNKNYFGNENTVDSSIEAEVSLIQLTFVNIFFARAFEFLSAFQSQIESLKEGASVAAQRAKENLISAYQNQAQVCLNIQITAPILVVPKLSTSLEAIILDMGVLTMKNTIHELDTMPDGDTIAKRPLIDTIKCNLQNLKMIRRSSGTSSLNQFEKTFVIPVTLDISLKRNLSVSWYRGIPDLEVNAHLGAINIKLTHNDICAIAGILRGNINESLEVWEYQRSSRLKSDRKPVKEKETKTGQMNLIAEETIKNKDPQEVMSHTLVKFAFYMDSVRFDAINDKEDGNEESEGLATFILETISLKGTMYSDSSIEMFIMLVSCILDDTRPGKVGRLTRLMERTVDLYAFDSSDENSTINSMIQIKYTKEDLSTFVDVKVYKFTLILSMDFLQKLYEFFTLDEPARPSVESKSKQSPKGETSPTEQNPTFTFNIRLEKPDIIIVESMDSIDTDALVFNAEMVSKLRFAGSRRIINATLTDIGVYSCCFNPSRRPYTLSQVIKPFTISVAGSTPESRGLHVDICLTQIAITINPHTIDLLTKCYKAFFKDPLTNQDTPDEVDYSDLWEVKEFDMNDYWFLKPEKGIDALTHRKSSGGPDLEDVNENEEVCLVTVPSILLTIEGRSIKRSIPLLLIEMGYQMQCYNWSKKPSINSSLTIQMQYYNKSQTAWEPVIEPVEVNPEKEEFHSYTPWELTCSVETEEEGEIDFFQPPKFQITVSCADILQLTITKTGLKALQSAFESYTSPVKQEMVKTSTRDTAPIIILNKTGLKVDIMLLDSHLEMCKSVDESYEIVTLNTDSELELQVISEPSGKKPQKIRGTTKLDSILHVKFPLCSKKVFQLPLGLSSKRYYPFPVEGKECKTGEVWGLVSDISVVDQTTKVILRSTVRVRNDFNEPVNIYVLSENEKETHFVGTAERNSLFPLPFQAIYNQQKLLFFSVNGYSLSTKPFHWEQIKSELNTSVLLQCNSKTPENNDPFFMQVVGETENIYYTNTKRKTISSVCYIIHLQPTVKIFNSLPVPLSICFQGVAREKTLLPGNTLQITNAEPGLSTVTLMIYDYLEKNWSCKENIPENPAEYFVWKFTSYNGLTPEFLNLGVRVTQKRKTAVYAIYCPYFMVNKTEYLLAYKFEGNQSVFYHPGDYKPPIMFTPSIKKFFSKKFAYLQVGHSSWSDKFPVDVAGSGGTIECEDCERNMVYMVSVTIHLTKNSLTKIVTFTPYYIFVNSAPYDIQFIESYVKNNHWLNIPSGSCVPFWPQSREKEKTIKIRPKGSARVSPPFAYRSTDNVLLRLDHKYGGIFVDIQATNSGTYIMFQQYESGQAPVLIINDSEKQIVISEKDTKHCITLMPKQKVFYAWIAPTKSRQLFVKNSKHSKDILIINKEETGLIVTAHGALIRYVSFLDGAQRTLLFTEEENLVRNLSSIKTMQPSGFELVCKINGVGLSLVNDLTRVEILYLSLISTNTSWEVKKPGKMRFVKMKDEKSHKVEAAYQKYLDDLEVREQVNPVVFVTEKLIVNFERMQVVNSHHKKNKQLRRVFEPGLWSVYRCIDGQIMIHMKINRIQVDNQLLDCVFPIVLTPVPPPKTIVAELKGPRSFLELSILKTSEEQTSIAQYKYFKILIQEFHVKVDIGFIQNFYEFLAERETTDEEEKEKFRHELELTERALIAHVEFGSSIGRKSFYELLHFSPLKIHFSFSLAGTFDSGGTLPPALSVIFQSLGVTLTDMHDVIFRLSFFERKSTFLTDRQLVNEVITHYYGQTIRQAYVLLLGLDVIGNPFGLIVGIGEGVEAFFYEPFQGIVQGPSDFAAGVAIGCKRFFKGTVGSTAGTLEKLTGTLGKGLAALSLDRDYQMQRIENSQREETIHASMARGGKELFMGVFDGLTGVVRKPIAGAKEEGVGGFFKGMGKGMMGLVTRPVTGVVDFASTSLNAVKRAAVGVYGVKRVRPPRFFRDECLVQPYHFYDAKGNLLLYSLCKRRYCKTDKYEYFFEMRNKEFVILTNKRVILAEFNETFESWQEHMSILWQSMPDCPRFHSKGVALTLRNRNNKKAPTESKSEVKILLINDSAVKDRMLKKMVELYNLEKEQEFFR